MSRWAGGPVSKWRRTTGIPACLVIALLLTVGVALAFDPPRIIGVLTSPLEDQTNFATDFCWVGDQNGDGFDDLIVNQEIFNDTLSKVFLFRGGDTIVAEPAFIWSPYEEGLSIGREVVYLGSVDEGPSRVAFLSVKRNNFISADFFTLGAEPDNAPILIMRGVEWEGASVFHDGYLERPKDINGDGLNDFLFIKQRPPDPTLQIAFGREGFDTLPDWEVNLRVRMGVSGATKITGGCDINRDGFDDFLIHTRESDQDTIYYSLYLGGNPPETVPVIRISTDENNNLGEVFAMLPDINGDGYDDWGISWLIGGEVDENWEGGVKVFYGGEEPDSEPDLTLNSEPLRGLGVSGLCGGDFNGDGKGDVVYIDGGGYNQPVRRMSVHFGNRWINGEQQPDIYVSNMMREYGYESAFRLGAVGDYNGDGVDDFVAYLYTYLEDHYEARGLAIFAGNRGWRLSATRETPPPIPSIIELSVSPNPFNGSTCVDFSVSKQTNITLSLYDVEGSLLQVLNSGHIISGKYSFNIEIPLSGLYFLSLQSENHRIIRKLVCIK